MNEQTLSGAFKSVYDSTNIKPQDIYTNPFKPNKQHIIERLEHIAKYGGSQMELDRLEKQLKEITG